MEEKTVKDMKDYTRAAPLVGGGWRWDGEMLAILLAYSLKYLITVYGTELSRKVQIMSILSDQTCPGGATRRLVTSDDQHQIELTRTA